MLGVAVGSRDRSDRDRELLVNRKTDRSIAPMHLDVVDASRRRPHRHAPDARIDPDEMHRSW